MAKIAVERFVGEPASSFADRSWILAPPAGVDAQLLVGSPIDEARIAGAFERTTELGMRRRGSGGATVHVGPGTLWVTLRLARASALVPCEPARLLNRYVRPLLGALTKIGARAAYFDRDWIAVAHRPAGIVAFAHEAETGASTFEAFVAVTTPFAVDARPSYRGKEPGTLESIASRSDVARITDEIVAAYTKDHSVVVGSSPASSVEHVSPSRAAVAAPWAATRAEAIGLVAAGRDAEGALRLGGEFMAARDAIAALERDLASLSATAAPDEVGAVVDRRLGDPKSALFGVRSLVSIRDVIVDALRAQ